MNQNLELEMCNLGMKFGPIELKLPEDMPMADWSHIGQKLIRSRQMFGWWLGDWAAFGERKYGKLREFATANGISPQTISNSAWVSRSVETSRRREDLDWSVHAEVAALKPKEQDKWLDRVASERMSVSALRKEIRVSNGEDNALESEGKSLELPTQHYDRLKACLEKKPPEFWTDTVKEIWSDRFNALIRLIPQ